MPIVPKPNDSNFAPVPPGNHIAKCYRIVDLGTQRGEYMGEITHRHKILLSWEIPDEKMDDGQPFTIGQRFTWSMSEKATLRKTLESWRGKAFAEADFERDGFDIKNILGVGCMLNVVHATKGDKTYANIASIAKLPKGMVVPVLMNKPVYVWLSKEEFEPHTYAGLSDSLKTIIEASPEYRALSEPEHIVRDSEGVTRTLEDMDDEIPF